MQLLDNWHTRSVTAHSCLVLSYWVPWEWRQVCMQGNIDTTNKKLWKTVWYFFKKTKLPLITQQLDSWLFIPKKWTFMFTQKPVQKYANSFIQYSQKCKQSRWPSTGICLNKLRYIHVMKYYSGKKEQIIFTPTNLNGSSCWMKIANFKRDSSINIALL